jgi:hypothetical protein
MILLERGRGNTIHCIHHTLYTHTHTHYGRGNTAQSVDFSCTFVISLLIYYSLAQGGSPWRQSGVRGHMVCSSKVGLLDTMCSPCTANALMPLQIERWHELRDGARHEGIRHTVWQSLELGLLGSQGFECAQRTTPDTCSPEFSGSLT